MKSFPQEPLEQGVRLSLYLVALHTLLALVKVAGGILGNSRALISDGIESVLDIFSSLLVWGGLKVSQKPPDEDHPFGHGKAESLAALAICLLLFGAAFWIGWDSLSGLWQRESPPEVFTLWIVGGVFLLKEGLYHFLVFRARRIGSRALEVEAWHQRSDGWTSLVAFVGISLSLWQGGKYAYADEGAALVTCGIIFWNGVRFLHSALHDLMDGAPSVEIEEEVRELASQVEGVRDIEKCRLRRSGPYWIVDIHIQVDGDLTVRQGHSIGHRVKDVLCESGLGIADVHLHVEPYGPQGCCEKSC